MRGNGVEAIFKAVLAKNFLNLIKAFKPWIKTYFEIIVMINTKKLLKPIDKEKTEAETHCLQRCTRKTDT